MKNANNVYGLYGAFFLALPISVLMKIDLLGRKFIMAAS